MPNHPLDVPRVLLVV